MIGIYKITSPTNKIYIGQSIDIEKRWKVYLKMKCKEQPKLYNSFKKHGVDNHKFEIICQCSIDELNEMERFYQDAFCVINGNGLNCILTETLERHLEVSEETRKKRSLALKGKKRPKELCDRLSLLAKGRIISDETKAKISFSCKGRIVSFETRAKQSESLKNPSEEIRLKISISSKGRKHTEETKEKISKANKGRPKLANKGRKLSDDARSRISAARKGKIIGAKIVLHLLTGVYFDNAKIAASTFGYKYGTFKGLLNGNSKNTSNCIYI